MAGTLTIPLTTLTPGEHDLPPAGGQVIPDADSSILLSIDRTVANGLNSKPATTTIFLQMLMSSDGGATWKELAANTIVGGIFSKGGNQINTDHVGTSLPAGTGRQMRAVIIVSGASVAVAGSLATA